MSSILRVILLREIPEDENLRQQWDALVWRVRQPQVFYTYEWSLAVQRAYHPTLHPLLFLAYDETESLCAVASLACESECGHVTFLCATTGDYCDFFSSPEQKPAFVAEVLAELRRLNLGEVTLTNLPADSDTVAAIQHASGQNGYRCFARTAYVCAQVSLHPLERQPGEGKVVLPRKQMLRRFLKALGREAPVRLDHARSWDTIAPLLPQFMQCHVARFLTTGRISNLARPERRRFLEELAKLLSESGSLTLTRLMAGSHTLAWNYGFQFQDSWFWYQPTFDSDLEKYSPGFCLLAKLIEEAADDPAMNIVDLGLGAEEYKNQFANQSRETLYVTLRASSAQHVREIVRYRAAQIIKTHPKLEAGVRACAAHVQKFKQDAGREGLPATMRLLAKQARMFLSSQTEVFFYEWRDEIVPRTGPAKLVNLDLNLLASAASQYADDEATLAYLLRSVPRLRDGKAEGFALIDPDGKLLHFAWCAAFDGFFLSELNSAVNAPAADCVMLFDSWTPVAARGHRYYGQTISRIARLMRENGKKSWTFSTSINETSMRSLEKTGFQRRYSLIRRRDLGWQRIKGTTPRLNDIVGKEVSARA